jgi:M6 family metalloprotease-like protein
MLQAFASQSEAEEKGAIMGIHAYLGRLLSRGLVAALALLALVSVFPGRAEAENGLVPLYGWYASGLGDNFATSDPAWAASRSGERRGAYGFDRVIGQVFDPAKPQPPNTRKLFRWFSRSRGDMFTTTDPAWAGVPGDTRLPDYRFVRMEGFVQTTVRAGTRPLGNWYDPLREDNFLTSEPEWSGPVGTTRGGYMLFRSEGYIVNPPGGAYPEFGYERVTAQLTSSFANPRPAHGTRPLLVVLLDYLPEPGSSNTISHSRSTFEALFRGGPVGSPPAYPNIVDYFRENSYGQFTWSIASILRVQYPGTRTQAAAAGNPNIGATVVGLAARAGFDFCALDRGFRSAAPDGKITSDELGVIWLGAAAPSEGWGQTVGATSPAGVRVSCPGGRNVDVFANTSGVPEGAGLSLVAHELTHQLGADSGFDIYGACGCMSIRTSLMGPSFAGDDDRSFHFDPWTKIQLGWIKPRVYAITNPRASLALKSAHVTAPPEPVLLYDPRAGRLGKREYYLLEYRAPQPRTYDANIADTQGGLATWYVQTIASGSLAIAFNLYAPGQYLTNWIVGSPPDVALTGLSGQSTLWRPSHNGGSGATSCLNCLRWLDGTDAGIRFRVRSQSATGGEVEWFARGSGSVSTRIDELRGTSGAPGRTFVLYGDFGTHRDLKTVYLLRKATGVSLPIEGTWRAGRVTVRVPAGTPPGAYDVVVYSDSEHTVASNRMRFRVLAP